MGQLITASVDVTKIDKARLVAGKKGGKYLSLTIWVNEEVDQYGNNVSVEQSLTKEEREGGAKKLYLGNGKTWGGGGGSASKPPATVSQPSSEEVDEIPF